VNAGQEFKDIRRLQAGRINAAGWFDMKTYVLNQGLDSLKPRLSKQISDRALAWKSSNEIGGLIRGLLADGVVNQKEAEYFREWMKTRADSFRQDPVASVLVDRLSLIYADGVVTDEELQELRTVLTAYAGEENKPTSLPLDDPAPQIVFASHAFCFTGPFSSGSRKWCQDQVMARGGVPLNNVVLDLHYLVIGSKVSPAWANTSYGRKIETAMSYRDERRLPLRIVTEAHWAAAL